MSAIDLIIARGFDSPIAGAVAGYNNQRGVESDLASAKVGREAIQGNQQRADEEMGYLRQDRQAAQTANAELQELYDAATQLSQMDPADPRVQAGFKVIALGVERLKSGGGKSLVEMFSQPAQLETVPGSAVNPALPADSVFQRDPKTGKVTEVSGGTTAAAAASREAAAASREAAEAQRDFNRNIATRGQELDNARFVGQLADDLRTESKDFLASKDAYGRVLASSQNPSAAGDVAMIFSFMKMLDPGSVIRESEYATAANAGSVPDRVVAQYNKALSGEALAPDIRKDFLNRAKGLFAQQRADQDKRNQRYINRGKAAKVPTDDLAIPLDPATVPTEPIQPTSYTTPKGATVEILEGAP